MNSTIINKKKICINCGRTDYWFSKKMCKQCAISHSTSKRLQAINKENETDDESLSNLISDLDLVFSRYIRIKYSDEYGNSECFTCGKKDKYQNLQCGHYISRSNLNTRFLEQNCKPQCPECNELKSGNLEIYSIKLEEEHSGIVDWLIEESRQISKPTRDDIKQLLIEYRSKLFNLSKKMIK